MKTKSRIRLCPLIVVGLVIIFTNSCKKDEDSNNPSATVTDKDGNGYTSVTIGTQVWMVENLKTSKYNDGTPIPNVTNQAEWSNLTTPGYCWYENNEATYKNTYGALYNWYAVSTGKLCPVGWHVPTLEEWQTLEDYLIANGYNYDGSPTNNNLAKALASATLWETSNNVGAIGSSDHPEKRNASGFTAVPAGSRGDSQFQALGKVGLFWSSTEEDAGWAMAWYRGLSYNDYEFTLTWDYNRDGISVRCLKD